MEGIPGEPFRWFQDKNVSYHKTKKEAVKALSEITAESGYVYIIVKI